MLSSYGRLSIMDFFAFSNFDTVRLISFVAILIIVPTVYFLQQKNINDASVNGSLKLANGTQNGTSKPLGELLKVKVGEVRVTKILVHPIKSCKGTSVSEARYTPEGLENDRKWCIIEEDTHNILTARELAKLVLIVPRLEYDALSPYDGQLVVSVPFESGPETFSVPMAPTAEVLRKWPVINDCTMFKVYQIDGYVCQSLSPDSPSPSEVLSRYFGKNVLLVMKGPVNRECPPSLVFPELKATAVFQDVYPLLVASEESLVEVSSSIQKAVNGDYGHIGGLDPERWKDGKIEIERFRPNIVIKGAGIPFYEELVREVVVGPELLSNPEDTKPENVITLVAKCARCLLPNVDTTTGLRDAAVPYKIMMKYHKDEKRLNKPIFGANGVYGGNGVVHVGDYVQVKRWARKGEE
ncbi:MOSC N-terminal beta barrel domain-containing protein [Abortiporus biennis]|nr:MOSC N-terminal beta barrel domain-containing protein [Abortiporus biennis]